jgi:hypothetical protein
VLEQTSGKFRIPDKYLPEQISFISAFKRGISDIKATLDKEGILVRLVSSDSNTRTLAIVRETVDSKANKADHDQIGLITADKTAESITCTPSYGLSNEELTIVQSVEEKVKNAYDESINHNTDDIRRVITNFSKECSVSLRDSGGIYFVPLVHAELLVAIADFVKAVSPGSVIYIKPEYIIRESDLEALQTASKNELTGELNQLENTYLALSREIQTMLDDNETPGTKKKKQLSNQLNIYLDMKKRIETFSGTLEFVPDEFVTRIRVMYEALSILLKKLKIKISSDFDQEFLGLGILPALPSPSPTPNKSSDSDRLGFAKMAEVFGRLGKINLTPKKPDHTLTNLAHYLQTNGEDSLRELLSSPDMAEKLRAIAENLQINGNTSEQITGVIAEVKRYTTQD